MVSKIKEQIGIEEEELPRERSEGSEVFSRIMMSTDSDTINEVANFIWDAFIIRERIVSLVE